MATLGSWHPLALPVDVIDLVSSDDSDDSDDVHDGDRGRDWKVELKAAIDAIETYGDFATTKQYGQYANPGLQINDTLINLPLDLAQVPVIRGASRQAPFGRGDQTLVDTSVRSTWEFNASQFRIANPAWGEFISAVLRDVSQDLGMTDVKTELYKLLLYEKGSFFKRHKDSEKAPDMIGTLSICLPSAHEGGEVYLSHAGKDCVIDTSKNNLFDISTLAWYADVTHEIKPVQNGHRLVLIYNIIQTGNAGPKSAASFEKQDARIDNAVARLLASDKPRRILYFLEHDYSQANLRLDHLKGRDRAVAQSVEKACANNGCYLFLCNITKRTTGMEESGYDDEDLYRGPKFAIDTLATSDGQVFASQVSLSRKDVLGRGPYGINRTADSESEGEDTGNEGAPVEYRYYDSAVVIVPKDQLDQLFQFNANMRVLFDMAMANFEANAKDSVARQNIARFLTNVVRMAPEFSPAIMVTAWDIQDYTLFDTAVHVGIQISSSYAPVRDTLVELIDAYQGGPVDWTRSLGAFAIGHYTLAALSKALGYISERLTRSDLQPSFLQWRTTMELSRVGQQTSSGLAAHDPFLELASMYWENHNWIQGTFVPTIQYYCHMHLQSKIICSLLQKDREGVLPNAKQIVITILESSETRQLYLAKIYMADGLPDKEEGDRFLQLLDDCLLSGLQQYVDELLRLSLQTVRAPPPMMPHSYFHNQSPQQNKILAEEMLYTMSKIFEKNKLSSEPARDFFLAILRNFVLRDKPVCPSKLPGHAHRPRGCRQCALCPGLDRFLTSPTEEQHQFIMGTLDSQHLESRLPAELFRCITVNMPIGTTKQFVLTVIKLGREYEKEMEEYKARLRKLIAKVQPLRTEYVRALLGDGPYGECVMLDGLPYAHEISLREAGDSKTNEK